jgi:hypothetical protein
MSGEGGPLIRMVLLGLGVVLLDYSSQAAINPCEALMSDMMAEVQTISLLPPPPPQMTLFSLFFCFSLSGFTFCLFSVPSSHLLLTVFLFFPRTIFLSSVLFLHR